MKKVYKELTNEQEARGVIFSSELIGGGKVHEVTQAEMEEDSIEAHKKIKRLLDDSFFNNSPYKRNEIHASDKISRLYKF